MNKIKKNVTLLLVPFLVLIVLYMTHLIAAPVGDGDRIIENDRIIESVEIIDDIHRSQVTIKFSFPIRYEKHFPLHKGNELRIRLLPLVVPTVDLDAVFSRESVAPRQTELVPLEEVVYEGDFSADGFYVQLSFITAVAFDVEQGTDFRSIVVYVCEQEYSNKLKRCLD